MSSRVNRIILVLCIIVAVAGMSYRAGVSAGKKSKVDYVFTKDKKLVRTTPYSAKMPIEDRVLGMIGISIIAGVISGAYQLIVYLMGRPKRKRIEEQIKQSQQVSTDGKIYCLFCKQYTDTETDKECSLCKICGRQRGMTHEH
jgi:hypothetical protein